MINYLDIKPLRIYNTRFNLILNPDDKLKNSAVILLTPNYNSTLNLIQNKYIVNRRWVIGYYFEPYMSYYLSENGELNSFEDITGINEFSMFYEGSDEQETTGPNKLVNPTKPKVKSTTVDGKKILPTKKTANMLRDPKSLMRHLRYDMRRPKYKLNTLKPGKSNVGGTINNPKGIENGEKLLNQGKQKEINRKKKEKWIEKNLKYSSKENTPKGKEVNTNATVKESTCVTFNSIQNNPLCISETRMIPLNPISEAKYTPMIKRSLMKDRIKTTSEINKIFRKIRKDTNNKVKLYNTDLSKYKEKNIFYDLSYYNKVYFDNIDFSNIGFRELQMYNQFLNTQLHNKALDDNGYKYKCLIIPINDWVKSEEELNYKKHVNPVSILMRGLRRKDVFLDTFKDIDIILMSDIGFVKFNTEDKKFNRVRLMNLITKMVKNSEISETDEDYEKVPEDLSTEVVDDVIEDLETKADTPIKSTPIKSAIEPTKPVVTTTPRPSVVKPVNVKNSVVPVSVPNQSTTSKTKVTVKKEPKEEVIKKAETTIQKSIEKKAKEIPKKTKEEVIKAIDNDDEINREVIKNIQTINDLKPTKVKVSTARSKRMEALKKNYESLTIEGQKVSDLLKVNDNYVELKKSEVKVDSPNEGWKDLKFNNFEKAYNLNSDLALILNSFSENKEYPVFIRDIKVENTSTSQDFVETYTVTTEDADGKRSTLKFDIPILVDEKFMKLKGNKKTMQKQVAPLPICKIDDSAAQITTNYMKVTVTPYGIDGKSVIECDTIIRLLKNGGYGKIKVNLGNNKPFYDFTTIRPIDFIDLSAYFSEIIIDDKIVYEFNLKKLKEAMPNTPLESNDSYLVGYQIIGKKKEPIYYNYYSDKTFSYQLLQDLTIDEETMDRLAKLPKSSSTKTKYSRAKILSIQIPVIILASFYNGLEYVLNLAKIKYDISDTNNFNDNYRVIRLKDSYLGFENTYENSMLLSGLAVLDTKEYTIDDLNSRAVYIEWLNENGYGLKIDGILNFQDLMMDPITVNCCKKYGLPTTFIGMLIYASNLLVDNKYELHTDMAGRRIRSTELIAGYAFSALAKGYQEYANQKRHGRNVPFTIKQSAIIDLIMVDPTFSDMPLLNDLQIFEAGNAVSYKGLSGMNNMRSYSLDKRTYSKSMLNILGMATGFSGNSVGVNRQLTIDPNVETQRGFVKTMDDVEPDELNLTKTFTMAEAVTPYGATRNDPIRSAMNFIQTTSHSMRVEKGSPSLVTNGADQALPYLSDNTFSYKAKMNGKVKKLTDDYILVEYKDKSSDLIDLRTQILKNSNGGFFTTSKLDPKVKEGKTFKAGEILAFDKNMYSDDVALGDNISYKLGTLSKLAIFNTEEGFEDSAVITETLSEQMASDVVEIKDVSLSKNTNILNIVKVGDPIQEGDPLIVFQDAGDEEYVSQLMSAISTDKDKYGIGTIPINSKVTGVVRDIKIYRSVPVSELRPSLRKLVNDYEKSHSELEKVAVANKIPDSYKYKVDTLPNTGKLKKVKDGVLIEFYLEYHDKMGIGDKLIYLDAVKGVVNKVIPDELAPRSTFRPEEKVDSFVSKGSLDARMVTSIQIVGSINKVLIELDRSIKEELGIKWKPIDELGK